MLIKLYVDEYTKRILNFTKKFSISEGMREDYYIIDNSLYNLDTKTLDEYDCYYIDGEVIKKDKDLNEHYNQLRCMADEILELEKTLSPESILHELTEQGKSLGYYSKVRFDRMNRIFKLRNEMEEKARIHEQKIEEYIFNVNKEIDSMLKNKYYSAICLLIKNENEYLIEWVNWHIDVGIDHIYIYDNGSETPVIETLKELPSEKQEKITVIDWVNCYEHMQYDCYNHCIKNYGSDCRWIGFMDSDEFLRIIEGSQINDFLKNYERYGALYINWTTYNANGKEKKENYPVRSRFTKVVNEDMGWGKIFTQPARTRKMLVHQVSLKPCNKTCNENFNIVEGSWSEYSASKITIDHYCTKSYEEWCAKIKRGSSDPEYRKKYIEFFNYNRDMVHLKDESLIGTAQGYDDKEEN